jgi:hypothetical protein
MIFKVLGYVFGMGKICSTVYIFFLLTNKFYLIPLNFFLFFTYHFIEVIIKYVGFFIFIQRLYLPNIRVFEIQCVNLNKI